MISSENLEVRIYAIKLIPLILSTALEIPEIKFDWIDGINQTLLDDNLDVSIILIKVIKIVF